MDLNRAELQGNILRGYNRNLVRHLVIEVTDGAAARTFLGIAAAGGDVHTPALTTEDHWGETKPDLNFNVGMTHEGLRALGVPATSLVSFPIEFRQGIEARAVKIGDVGTSAPSEWEAPFDDMDRVHLIVSLHADKAEFMDAGQAQVAAAGGGKAFNVLGVRDGANFAAPYEKYVHFGYHDNISQPRFQGIHDPARFPDDQPQVPLGTVLLGYPTVYEGIDWALPRPNVLGNMGAFNAFRVLEQEVDDFEAFLTHAADVVLADPRHEQVLPKGAEKHIGKDLNRKAAMRELIAAMMCGRWRNGTPMELSPLSDEPEPPLPKSDWSKFDYNAHSACPYGSHTRRANPRGGPIVQRIANNTRRLVRRGVPYGPPYDPAKPDKTERGLLGNFLCANLGAQFEAVMCDWVNLGLQDPHITGTNDPLLGANDVDESWFDVYLPDGDSIRIGGLPRLINARGGAYTFLPSVPAIQYIAQLPG